MIKNGQIKYSHGRTFDEHLEKEMKEDDYIRKDKERIFHLNNSKKIKADNDASNPESNS